MNLTIFLLVSSHYRTHHNNHNAKPPCSLVSYLPFSLPWYYCKQDNGNLRRTTRYRNYFRYYKFSQFFGFSFFKGKLVKQIDSNVLFLLFPIFSVYVILRAPATSRSSSASLAYSHESLSYS